MRFGVLVAAFCGAVVPLQVFAQDNEQKYVLDGVTYTKDQLIDDFLNVAFSDLPWNVETGEEDRQKILAGALQQPLTFWESLFVKEPRALEEAFSPNRPLTLWESIVGRAKEPKGPEWFSDHLAKNLALPLSKRGVITKWEGPDIQVGLGWPRYGLNHRQRNGTSSNHNNVNIDKYFPDFAEKIARILPDISAATGLPVTLVQNDSPAEETVGYPRIRIIPFDGDGMRTWLSAPICYSCALPLLHEHFLNGILFHTYSRYYFDGYLLPDASSALDVAICKIASSVDDAVLAVLVNECLVRSLGLPAMSKSKSSLMSHWRVHEDDNISNKRLDVFRIESKYILTLYMSSIERLNDPDLKPEEEEKLLKGYLLPWNVVSIGHDVLEGFRSISAYDKAMISLLYCPSIKSGMEREDVKKILSSDNACFSRLSAKEG